VLPPCINREKAARIVVDGRTFLIRIRNLITENTTGEQDEPRNEENAFPEPANTAPHFILVNMNSRLRRYCEGNRLACSHAGLLPPNR
jgi:hypothetical protein